MPGGSVPQPVAGDAGLPVDCAIFRAGVQLVGPGRAAGGALPWRVHGQPQSLAPLGILHFVVALRVRSVRSGGGSLKKRPMTGPDRVQLERMRRAIAALPKSVRAAYRLHLLDGLDYAAIAALLGIDCGEVEHCIVEAIVAIDRALREPGTNLGG